MPNLASRIRTILKGTDTQRIQQASIAAQTRSAKMASGASAMAMMPENPITNKPGTDGIS